MHIMRTARAILGTSLLISTIGESTFATEAAPAAGAASVPAATASAVASAANWVAPSTWFIYTIVFIVVFGSLITILVIRGALAHSTSWSLSDALSEETELSAQQKDSSGNVTYVMQDGKPVTVTVMRASSSRVIALMGLVVILLMFVGFGAFALYAFGQTGVMPDMDKERDFLLGGMTMFAPYLVNKFSSVFSSLSPKKQ